MSNLGQPLSKNCPASFRSASISKKCLFLLNRLGGWFRQTVVFPFLTFITFCLLCPGLVSSGYSQISENLNLTNEDVLETIVAFKTDQPQTAVKIFQAKMPASVSDPKRREEILTDLPKRVYELQVHNLELETKIKGLLKPVLDFYHRQYEIIIINHPLPYAMSDTGVVLILSTGLFTEAESDDEILGFIAHEVGHEYFLNYSIYTRQLMAINDAADQKKVLLRKFTEILSIIELNCDAFAALTLAGLGYDPTAFIEGIERANRKFSGTTKEYHPALKIRRQIVEGVIPGTFVNPSKRKLSGNFQAVKDLLKSISPI